MKGMINTAASLLIGVIVVVYLYALNAGWDLPFSENPRTTFIAFIVVGMALCTVGIGHGEATVGFTNPLMLLGAVIGVVNMYISYIALTGGQFLFINDYVSATMAIGGIMLVKVVIKIAMNLIYL